MKVILLNGSPKAKGSTYTLLREAEKALQEEGIATELIQVGNKPISGCIACGFCLKNDGKCFINDDGVNDFIEKVPGSKGFIFGSPVHYAAVSGSLTSFLDRAFYGKGDMYAGKPGAAAVVCRRGGASAAFDQINKYFTIANMPVVSSQYWNQVHGNGPEEVVQDLEGMQTIRRLGYNMAWLIKCIEAGKKSGIEFPRGEKKVQTNFIR